MRAPPASPSRPRCGCPRPTQPVLRDLAPSGLRLCVGITGYSCNALAVACLDDGAGGAPSRRRPQIAARIDVHSKNARLLALSCGAPHSCVQGFCRAMWRSCRNWCDNFSRPRMIPHVTRRSQVTETPGQAVPTRGQNPSAGPTSKISPIARRCGAAHLVFFGVTRRLPGFGVI
jgi:hypothetical protein